MEREIEFQKSFTDCTLIYLEKNFGLRPTPDCSELDSWLKNDLSTTKFENDELELLQALLKHNVMHWNEQELSLHVIGPMLSLARFISLDLKYNLFAERFISATVENLAHEAILLSGKPDGILATGYREPESPIFALTVRFDARYKKEIDPNGQPAGQVLAAMLVAQSINQLVEPIYGCYIIGQNWYFLTLIGKHYCISPAYSALTNEILMIFKALKALNEIAKVRVG